MLSLTGCGAVNSQNENMENISESGNNSATETENQTEKEEKEKNQNQQEETKDSSDMDTLLTQAVLQGSVAEFSDGVIQDVYKRQVYTNQSKK